MEDYNGKYTKAKFNERIKATKDKDTLTQMLTEKQKELIKNEYGARLDGYQNKRVAYNKDPHGRSYMIKETRRQIATIKNRIRQIGG